MTDEEILEKAIEKAMENGYKTPKKEVLTYWNSEHDIYQRTLIDWGNFEIIFSHDFAKAFWGAELMDKTHPYLANEYDLYLPAWQYHLQQLVLCENPLDYLKKFL